jgi:small subunit ribosomal protein S2
MNANADTHDGTAAEADEAQSDDRPLTDGGPAAEEAADTEETADGDTDATPEEETADGGADAVPEQPEAADGGADAAPEQKREEAANGDAPETDATEEEAPSEDAADAADGPSVTVTDAAEEADQLIPVQDYLQSGVHIGTQQKTQDMERYIHRARDDGLYVLDIAKTDDRIRTAASFLSNYEPETVLVASSRQYGRYPAEQFADAIGARVRTGRFIPGTLTNPDYEGYIEPDVVVVTDPIGDAQAVTEAATVGLPVIAMCDSNNTIEEVDLVIPTNNKGRRALAVVYWLLANETLDARGAEPRFALDDFQSAI